MTGLYKLNRTDTAWNQSIVDKVALISFNQGVCLFTDIIAEDHHVYFKLLITFGKVTFITAFYFSFDFILVLFCTYLIIGIHV